MEDIFIDKKITMKNSDFLPEPVLVTRQKWPEGIMPLISIFCATYNQEDYIEDALKGFLMQKTTFPVRVVVFEDCSTDSTTAILKKYEARYPHLFKIFYMPENTYKKPIRKKVLKPIIKELVKAKYTATCEGDDYWTDPQKLQKQVGFLEAHPGYTLTCGGYKAISATESEEIIKTGVVSKDQETEKGFTFTLEDTLKAWITMTLTSVFRNNKILFDSLAEYKNFADIHLFYHLLKNGKGYYFKEVLGVYNVHEGGVFSLKSKEYKTRRGYFIYRELYQHNKDEISRLNYFINGKNVIHHRMNVGPVKNLSTFRVIEEVFPILKTNKERMIFLKSFIPEKIKRNFRIIKKLRFERTKIS